MAGVNQPPAPAVPMLAGAEECTTKIPEDIEREIPQVLVWTGRCRTAEQYIGLIKSAYKLLQIKRITLNGEGRNSLNFRFIGVDPQILVGVKSSTPTLANIAANVIGLNGLLTTIVSGAASYSSLRQVKPSCVEGFTNVGVNTELIHLCQQDDDDKAAQDYLYNLLVDRFIPLCQESILFLHKKARLGVEFFYEVEHLNQDIDQLKNDYQLMLTSLKNRASVNEFLFHCMATKKKAMDKVKTYASFWDERLFNHCISIFDQKLDVYHDVVYFDETDAPDDNNLTSWITQRTLYSHLVNAPGVRAESLSVFKKITGDIDPIISGVRTFTPTPLELAQEKAVYMRNSVTRIRKDSEDFLKPESEKTIGKARSLLEQIKSIRGAIDSLQLSGLVVSHETVGLTQDELEDFYVKISNALAQKEYEAKVNEAKQRAANNELAKGAPQLQLPPLNGFSSWLNFRKAINDIMPLHSNHLIKKQILLKSLKNREDHSRCQSMDYEDGFKYLVQRYESSALIPGLIDELLKLVPASTDRQAYENLTKLISTTSMIQSYEQIDKLDSNCRCKLISILLPRDFQIHFLKDETIFEDALKKELCPDAPLLDTISEASCLQTTEVEQRRRTWWLEQITTYTTVIREIVRRSSTANKESFADLSDSECPVCEEPHLDKYGQVMQSLSQCKQFRKLDTLERLSLVDTHNRCKRCLKDKNSCKIKKCSSHIKCFKCFPFSIKHHPLLHIDVETEDEEQVHLNSENNEEESCNED